MAANSVGNRGTVTYMDDSFKSDVDIPGLAVGFGDNLTCHIQPDVRCGGGADTYGYTSAGSRSETRNLHAQTEIINNCQSLIYHVEQN